MHAKFDFPKAFSVRDEHEFFPIQHLMARINPQLVVKQIATGVHVEGGNRLGIDESDRAAVIAETHPQPQRGIGRHLDRRRRRPIRRRHHFPPDDRPSETP